MSIAAQEEAYKKLLNENYDGGVQLNCILKTYLSGCNIQDHLKKGKLQQYRVEFQNNKSDFLIKYVLLSTRMTQLSFTPTKGDLVQDMDSYVPLATSPSSGSSPVRYIFVVVFFFLNLPSNLFSCFPSVYIFYRSVKENMNCIQLLNHFSKNFQTKHSRSGQKHC